MEQFQGRRLGIGNKRKKHGMSELGGPLEAIYSNVFISQWGKLQRSRVERKEGEGVSVGADSEPVLSKR